MQLAELAVGIGPFVVGPAVERKLGRSAMSQLAINATEWRSANWAMDNGLYAEIFETVEDMDVRIALLADKLAKSNPEYSNYVMELEGSGSISNQIARDHIINKALGLKS